MKVRIVVRLEPEHIDEAKQLPGELERLQAKIADLCERKELPPQTESYYLLKLPRYGK